MAATPFNALFLATTEKPDGWLDVLVEGWPCLTEDQKELILCTI